MDNEGPPQGGPSSSSGLEPAVHCSRNRTFAHASLDEVVKLGWHSVTLAQAVVTPSEGAAALHNSVMAHSEELQRLVDEDDLQGLLDVLSVEDIADAWWRYQLRDQDLDTDEVDHPDWWAVELWFGHAVYESTDCGHELIHALAERAPEGADLGLLGAGPVENYMGSDEASLLWVETEARRSENYRKALANVWIDHLPPDAFLRVEAAAGTELPWPDFGHGERPRR